MHQRHRPTQHAITRAREREREQTSNERECATGAIEAEQERKAPEADTTPPAASGKTRTGARWEYVSSWETLRVLELVAALLYPTPSQDRLGGTVASNTSVSSGAAYSRWDATIRRTREELLGSLQRKTT